MLCCSGCLQLTSHLPLLLFLRVFLGGDLITGDENFKDNLIPGGAWSRPRVNDEEEGDPHEKLYKVFCLAYTGDELGTKIQFFFL